MKRMKIALVGGLIASLLIPGSIFASNVARKVEAYANDSIKLYVNNKLQQLKEADGSNMSPIVVNGRTYLPVRAVTDMLGAGLVWDSETKSIYISTTSNNEGLPHKDNTPTGSTAQPSSSTPQPSTNTPQPNTSTTTAKGTLEDPIPLKTTYKGKWDSTYKDNSLTADITMTVNEVLTGSAAVSFAEKNGYKVSDLKNDKLEYIAFKYTLTYNNITVKNPLFKNKVYASAYFKPYFQYISGKTSVIGGTDIGLNESIQKSFDSEEWVTGSKPKKAEYVGWHLGIGLKGEKTNILKTSFKPYENGNDRYTHFVLTN
ncbi:MAG: copper amine oxidase N-terminal domain-containing protein [Clostridia bacterium]|nr:copper amine oxidase N-terminal domain-containing protein [Clostridia bacterium]